MILALRISLKNSFRKFAHHVYRQYERWLKHKMPLYDLEMLSLIRRLPEDAVCIDVGVNEAQLFSTMVTHCKKGTLHGFEPIPQLHHYLQKKYQQDRVHLYPLLLADRQEDTTFYYFPKRTAVSGMSRRWGLFRELEAVEISTKTHMLDEVLDLDRIDLIKIDVEGAELKVLHGARAHINKCRPIIVFECGYGGLDYFKGTPEQVFDYFDALGYGISLLRYYLDGHLQMDRHTFLYIFKHRYEYQFIAWPLQR